MSERVEFELLGGGIARIDPQAVRLVCDMPRSGTFVRYGEGVAGFVYVKGTAAEVEAKLRAAGGDRCREALKEIIGKSKGAWAASGMRHESDATATALFEIVGELRASHIGIRKVAEAALADAPETGGGE